MDDLLTSGDRSHRRLTEQGVDFRNAVQSLRTFQTDVAIAWDLQLREYSDKSDLDTYAVDVMRLERARMSLNLRLSDVLNGLSAQLQGPSSVHDPVFVLGVDDFDLNPARCVDLMRLLRTISIPRLFIVVLGDVSIARSLFNFKVASELADVLQPYSVNLERGNDIDAIAGGVSSNAIRKLIHPTAN